jgi:hypothetical protein
MRPTLELLGELAEQTRSLVLLLLPKAVDDYVEVDSDKWWARTKNLAEKIAALGEKRGARCQRRSGGCSGRAAICSST